VGWLSASQALHILGVRPQTLYAYVSRARIRARRDPQDPRRSLYLEADVRKHARRPSGARRAERVAAGAIEWGDPILPSAVSTVAEGRLWYRGQDAVALAEGRTLEQIASLLWEAPSFGLGDSGSARRPVRATAVLPLLFRALAARAARDPPSHGRALAVLRDEASDVLRAFAHTIVGASRGGMLHERLAAAWQRPRAADMIRRALVLLADHELNASTFATRVTVSTGASLAAGVLAGLATLSGPLHGRASFGVLEVARASRRRGARAAVREWLLQGRPLSGFGHPLYPQGDVRASALLRQFAAPAGYEELRLAVAELAGELPNVDFALCALMKAFRLPVDAPLTLFALARSVGWLAHSLEQVSAGHLIRPRARYVGPPVGMGRASVAVGESLS